MYNDALITGGEELDTVECRFFGGRPFFLNEGRYTIRIYDLHVEEG
jgi:hypothetical protein